MTTNSQLSTMNLKKEKRKTMKTKTNQANSQNRNRITEIEITLRVISGQGEGRNREEKVQGIRSINGTYKIDRMNLSTVQEIEKPKNLYVQPMDMSQGDRDAVEGRVQSRGE